MTAARRRDWAAEAALSAAVLLLPDMRCQSGRTLRALLILFALFTAFLAVFPAFD